MIEYLTPADVVDLAEEQGFQIRDFGLLESAVERPRATAFGQDAYPTLLEKAAAKWVSRWAVADPARSRVAALLADAGLVSAEAVAEVDDRLRVYFEMFEQAVEAGLLIDLPIDYLAASFGSQFEVAIAAPLSEQQRDQAFFVAWNGIAVTPIQDNKSG